MSRYFRKKPVVIEAMQFTSTSALNAIISWSDGAVRYSDSDGVFIDTLEGRHHVSDDDWVIKGVKGEFYACKPDIFEMTYEPAARPASAPGSQS